MRDFLRAVPVAVIAVCLACGAIAQQPGAKPKAKKAKAEVEKIDPWGRPEGSIVEQSARYYVWYDNSGWHVRSAAKGQRTFHGTISVKNARIKSCVPIGVEDAKKKGQPDAWRVNEKRTQLTFRFKTSTKSDGFDIDVEGDGTIEFELSIDNEQKPQAIFVGQSKRHPAKSPFSQPATPAKPGQ